MKHLLELIVMLSLLLCGCAAECAELDHPVSSTATESSLKPKDWIKVRPVRLKCKHKGYVVDVSYPRFNGTAPELVKQLNRAAKRTVNMNIAAEPGEFGVEYSYTCEYKVRLITPEVVSIDFDFYRYQGGAHGSRWHVPFNYRLLPDLHPITIRDLFAGERNRSIVCGLIAKQLEPDLDVELDANDIARAPLSKFTLTRTGIVFVFDEYALGCYALGCPETTLNTRKIKHLLSPQYATFLASLLQK